jgi:hypothetical protein
MSVALEEIRAVGVDWVSIHPYGWVGRDGTIRFQSADETGFLAEAVRRMRAAGVQIFWKPHLGYWGSFEWRGAIDFGDDEAAWRRFFAGYRDFIVDQARFAAGHGIDLFAVGVEYERTMHREADWRGVVAAVREVFPGPITYAANWDGLDRVPFWDAVDLLGVQAYFPLASDPAAGREALAEAWRGHLDDLRRLSEAHGKPVVFAEIGYNRAAAAAVEPWAHGTDDTPENRDRRSLLMNVALEAVGAEPSIAGMFWWKWIPGDRPGRDFSMRDAEAIDALRFHWGAAEPALR